MKFFEEEVADAITIAKTLGFGSSFNMLDMRGATRIPGTTKVLHTGSYNRKLAETFELSSYYTEIY